MPYGDEKIERLSDLDNILPNRDDYQVRRTISVRVRVSTNIKFNELERGIRDRLSREIKVNIKPLKSSLGYVTCQIDVKPKNHGGAGDAADI